MKKKSVTSTKELKEQKFQEMIKKDALEIFENFSNEETMKIAFVPCVISHIAFSYGKKCREAAAANKISILKPLTKAFDKLSKDYIEELSIDLDLDHRNNIEVQAERLINKYAWDFQLFRLSVNSEFKKEFPEYPFAELRTDALCGVVMIDILDEHNMNIDKMLEARLGRPQNSVANPKLEALRHLLMGFAGDPEKFNFSAFNIDVSSRIILKRICEMDFEVKEN